MPVSEFVAYKTENVVIDKNTDQLMSELTINKRKTAKQDGEKQVTSRTRYKLLQKFTKYIKIQ